MPSYAEFGLLLKSFNNLDVPVPTKHTPHNQELGNAEMPPSSGVGWKG